MGHLVIFTRKSKFSFRNPGESNQQKITQTGDMLYVADQMDIISFTKLLLR